MSRLGGQGSARLLVVLLVSSLLLVGPPGLPGAATVSGENGQIAFVSDRDGNSEIYLMNSDGSGPVNLTNHPAGDFSPTWSPDGRQIAFWSDRDGAPAVYTMTADGTELRRISAGQDPAWSPDGSRIALSREGSIFLVWLNRAETRLTDPSTGQAPPSTRSTSDSSPAWSPDGTRLAFLRHYQGPTPTGQISRLFVVDAQAGGTPVPLADLSTANNTDWSPDGSTIAVADFLPHNTSSQVVLVSADGASRTALSPLTDFTHISGPGWSPDGLSLVASLYRINVSPGDLFVMRPDGSNPVNLTNHPASDTEPAWQPLNPYPVGLVNPTSGIWSLRHPDGQVVNFYYGNPGDIPFLGDWDCDGVETPGLYRQSDGFVYLRNANTQGIADIRFFFGNPGDIPLAGDFDGDGCDTLSIYRPSEARIYVINHLGSGDTGLGTAEFSYLFGDPGDRPFVGDFDGDGIDTVGLHRESTGRVYYRDSNTEGIADNTFIFGDPGDRLVAFDWDGDGSASPGLFRPSNSTFFFRFSNSAGVADARFIWRESDSIPVSHWMPVAGSFDSP
jgi:Tol biopolymer transport system component